MAAQHRRANHVKVELISKEFQDYLNTLDCDFIQGYHIGRPVPFDTFRETALQNWRGASYIPSTEKAA